MKIALRDTVHIRGVMGGANLFSVLLAQALAKIVDQLDVYSSEPDQYPGLVVRRVKSLYDRSRLRMGIRLLGKMLNPDIETGDYDCIIFPNQVEPLIRAPKSRRVVVVHDLLPLMFPKSYPRLYLYYRFHLGASLRKVDRIVTVSENTKSDVVRYFGLPHERISVIYEGFNRFLVSENGPSAPAQLPPPPAVGRYLLYVGSQLPHKNLVRLIEAFSRIRREHDVSLLLVGHIDPRYEQGYWTAAERCGVRDFVHMLGTVPHAQLAAVLRRAEALVFPSLYEGFGMPPLEAMAAGVPVAASRSSSIPEVCGTAAVYFDPLDVSDIAQKIARVLSDEETRVRCKHEGTRQVAKFDWNRTAQQFVEMIASL